MYVSIENQKLEARKSINNMSRAVSIQVGRRKSFVEKVEELSNGFVGHEVKKRAYERIIGKKGIYYKDNIYTFDGYEKYIGKKIYIVETNETLLFYRKNTFISWCHLKIKSV
ncbi:hypothetical protein [Sulfurimonas sp.]